jgi:hypothetical protein
MYAPERTATPDVIGLTPPPQHHFQSANLSTPRPYLDGEQYSRSSSPLLPSYHSGNFTHNSHHQTISSQPYNARYVYHATEPGERRNSSQRTFSYTYGTMEPRDSRRTHDIFVEERRTCSAQTISWLRRVIANPWFRAICQTVIALLIIILVFWLLVAGTKYMALALWSWMKNLGLGLKNWVVEIAQAILRGLKSWVE